MEAIAPKYKTKSEKGSTGGKGIAKQRMTGGEALMGAPRLYSPIPVRIKPGQLRHAANNRRQAQMKAERLERRRVFVNRLCNGDQTSATSRLKILALRDFEENGYPRD